MLCRAVIRRLFVISFLSIFLLLLLHMMLSAKQPDAVLISRSNDSNVCQTSEKLSERNMNHLLMRLAPGERRFGYAVTTSGSLLERVEKFNDAMSVVRQQIIDENRRKKCLSKMFNSNDGWDDSVLRAKHTFIWGARDDYLEELAANHRHITTVFLPWLKTESELSTSSTSGTIRWNSLTDKSNVLLQNYYQWTGDDQLCTWIETRGVIKMKYDSMFNQTCSRDLEAGAKYPHSPRPLIFYNKPIFRTLYWPNDGNSYPAHYYTTPPPSAFYVHIHQDAVVDGRGDVFSGNTSLAVYVCRDPYSTPKSSLPADANKAPLHDEIFSLGQMWATATFHRAVEVTPRLAPYVSFMKANPNIRIQAGEGAEGRLGEILKIFGLDPNRLISGTFRAKIIYQPRETGCGMASVQEAQLTANIYLNYIRNSFTSSRPRNRLILIRRTTHRGFTQHAAIETALKALATEYNLIFTPFYDKTLPSFNDTMAMFNAAVLVVGPHGAGLSNIMFSEPGTFVIEGVCNLPHVNLCFQRLAYVLGHRYHGITSRGGCEGHVDVLAEAVEQAARKYLAIYKELSTKLS